MGTLRNMLSSRTPGHGGAEQIATVLLQLKNNPGLFDSWASKHELAFKADARCSTPAVIGSR